jgi:hypothetical protein
VGGAAASTVERRLGDGLRVAGRGLDRIDGLRPVYVVAFFVVAEWAAVAALALVVRHNHWVYYQGGDQLWSYTSGWLLGQGKLASPLVGYLWGALLAPLTWIVGPNLVGAYPVILVVDTVVLLPLALAALYGLARLIAGRRFAVLALTVWLAAPFVGILLTNAGYHQRYTELILPQAFGLTAMTDFPTMVAALVAAYFTARVLFDGRDATLDALAAGVAAGAAIGIKPSTALFLAGPALALAFARRFAAMGVFVAGLLPAVVTLTLWKWRGYGYLPLLHSSLGAPSRSAAGQTVALSVPHYARFDWSHFERQLDLLREHFWSGRLIEWLVVAGLIAIGLRSRRALALVGGWFVAFAVVKGGYGQASIEDSSLLRILIPTIPAFVLLLAALPYLVPREGRPWPVVEPGERAPRRWRLAALGGVLLVTAVVPFAAIAAATPIGADDPPAVVIQQPLIPASVDLGVTTTRRGDQVMVSWNAVHSAGGAVFYHVFRAPTDGSALDCDTDSPAVVCQYKATDLGATSLTTFTDTPPKGGDFEYRVGVSANWLNDPTLGDVYELSRSSSSSDSSSANR